jgi:hypothetical protein
MLISFFGNMLLMDQSSSSFYKLTKGPRYQNQASRTSSHKRRLPSFDHVIGTSIVLFINRLTIYFIVQLGGLPSRSGPIFSYDYLNSVQRRMLAGAEAA